MTFGTDEEMLAIAYGNKSFVLPVTLVEAAPDLLAACKVMLKADGDNRYSAREFVEAKEMMAAAVAKAEGR